MGTDSPTRPPRPPRVPRVDYGRGIPVDVEPVAEPAPDHPEAVSASVRQPDQGALDAAWRQRLEEDVRALARVQILATGGTLPPPSRPSLVVQTSRRAYVASRAVVAVVGLLTLISELWPTLREPWQRFLSVLFE